jgi:hypothetical protein
MLSYILVNLWENTSSWKKQRFVTEPDCPCTTLKGKAEITSADVQCH